MTDDDLDDTQRTKRYGISKELADKIDREYDELFAADHAKLTNSVGKSISDMSVLEKEVRNKTLDDCIEKMERAIELIRKMKT